MTAPTDLSPDVLAERLAAEAARRRTFAIISHPDAGKTTLTEKLLLYGGAIHLAGSVKARRAARHATSDWMKLEQERGISVTSSVLQFDYAGRKVNLLDTPGHADFSEDTFRTLIAADSAVMLLDNRRGVEERTRQLFEVCHKRRTPIFTFVNKCDRAGEDPLKLLDDVERDLGITLAPVTWPIFDGDKFVGVYDRLTQHVYLFERGEAHGSEQVATIEGGLDAPEIAAHASPYALDKLREDLELLDVGLGAFDRDAFMAGELSPAFFGSALTNFGVEPFLREFVELAPGPAPRDTTAGPVDPGDPSFAGFVFKIQANMDPKHRDRMAFVRVVSGRYAAGMDVTLAAHRQDAAPRRPAERDGARAHGGGRGVLRATWWASSTRGRCASATRSRGRRARVPGRLPALPPRALHARAWRGPDAPQAARHGAEAALRGGRGAGVLRGEDVRLGAARRPIVGAVGSSVRRHAVPPGERVRRAGEARGVGYGHPRWVTGPKPSRAARRGHGRLLVYDKQGEPPHPVLRPLGDALDARARDEGGVPRERALTPARPAPG
jgi:peptide chain release factor 3